MRRGPKSTKNKNFEKSSVFLNIFKYRKTFCKKKFGNFEKNFGKI